MSSKGFLKLGELVLATAENYDDENRPLEKSLMRYVWKHTRSEQLWILFVILASMPTYFLILDLPVRIINEPIQGVGFEDATSTQQFMQITLGLPDFLGGASYTLFDGFELARWPYLIALSLLYLTLVCINGLFKFYINTYKGRLGERMLRRMRYQLVDRVLRFPINHFRRVKGSEVASMVKDEVEPFGEFIGDAFVQPAFLGGQALVAFAFILSNSFWLGIIAVVIIAFQVTLIPYLRRRVLVLGRMRQLTARLLSGRIGEIVESITSIHVNDTSNYERAELSNRLSKIFFIRYELYQRKFFVKFINNFLAQFTPFVFYVVGGYFAIRGTLNVGQLIGVINAYKDLPGPINGLVQWDQKRVDIDIKYGQIVEQFNVKGMSNAELQANQSEPVPPLEGEIQVFNLNVTDETGSVLIEDADFTLPIKGITAAIGPIGSGAGAVANTLAGIHGPTSGRVTLNGDVMTDLPEAIRGRRFAYVGSETYLPQSTLLDTLLYVTKHAPLRELDPSEISEEIHPRAKIEAKAAGNTLLNFHSDWIDYDAMGVSNPEEVFDKVREVLEVMDMDQTVYELAMRQLINPSEHETLCNQLIEVRQLLRTQLEGTALEENVEVFNWDTYSIHATIGENILFGSVEAGHGLDADNLASNSHMQEILAKDGLDRDLFEMGIELAETAIDLFSDLSPDNPFFEQLNFMSPEQLESYGPILGRAKLEGFEGVSDLDRQMLIQLPFGYIEPRNRLRLLDDEMRARLLDARHRFHNELPEEMTAEINGYHVDKYNPLNSVRDNILFGRVAHGATNATEQIQTMINSLLLEKGLEDDVFRVGLEFDIGTGGKRLTENQRQRILMSRALLKGADMLIVNRGLTGMDAGTQEKLVSRILERARGKGQEPDFGIFWVLTTPSLVTKFDSVLVFDRQKLVDKGTPSELEGSGSTYDQLVT